MKKFVQEIPVNDAKELALNLFVENVDIHVISSVTGRTVRTIQNWISDGNWGKMQSLSLNNIYQKLSYITSREDILCEVLANSATKEEREILENRKKEARGDLDALAKSESIRARLPDNVKILQDDMQALTRFVVHLAYSGVKSNLNLAKKIADLSRPYINNQYKELVKLR